MNKFFIFLTFFLTLVSSIDLNKWELFESNTHYLTISDKTMWKLERKTRPDNGGYPIHQWNYATQKWTLVSGSCVTLSLERAYLYCVNREQYLYRRGNIDTTSSWQLLNSRGFDMKVGFNDHIWFISTNVTAGGYEIFKFHGDAIQETITKMPGGGIKVAPTTDDKAWLVNDIFEIYRWDGVSWIRMPGSARDVIVGSDDLPLIVSTVPTDGGYQIMKWNKNTNLWDVIEGIGGVSLAVDSKSNPYVITNQHEVYRQKGEVSDFCPSK